MKCEPAVKRAALSPGTPSNHIDTMLEMENDHRALDSGQAAESL